MDAAEEEISAEKLKEQGNQAVKENKYQEAVLHYTTAIKLDPKNHTLYSNRSFAHLKLKNYYLALSDANETISLNPNWPKGYFRKGEVEYAVGFYTDAYDSYREALKWKPDDSNILKCLNNTAKNVIHQRTKDKQIPWVGAGIGIVIGVTMLVADFLTTRNPTHPLLMAIITIVISLVGYAIARGYRSYLKQQRKHLLDPPPELIKEPEDEKEEIKRTPRYTKSQARFRYKKGETDFKNWVRLSSLNGNLKIQLMTFLYLIIAFTYKRLLKLNYL
ncbi:uncharacterized protein LOC126734574 isoform X2 [Anthonomus grandis grandis]|uniref:uncharacterized protein LOC126734574 isoform X2 n=1 Tax=Anthonomus grandis grandis TaxID=2921223 RepID=UPI002165AD81|nr:uncharacterized protein LOC126734574 isoform X2 [Anthonomus grandis grandis]